MSDEQMEFDVVIVGAGPAGLAAACRLMQINQEKGQSLSVCVLDKGAEIGAHILSGAIVETGALDRLFPQWQTQGAPLRTPVTHDALHVLRSSETAWQVPHSLVPKTLHNTGNYIISLGDLCRWLAEQAEHLGVEVFSGFAAKELIIEEDKVKGVITGEMGVDSHGEKTSNYLPSMALRARYTVFAEGSRGHLGKQLIQRYQLDKDRDPQHYALGIKELWDVPESGHQEGKVIHTSGWPLSETGSTGGGFLYHLENQQVAVGLVVDLCYKNPHMDPFLEFQRLKTHPLMAEYLRGGKRVCYGARTITKGGLQSLPQMTFPGGMLIGCDAGTLNGAKIKGTHTAMQSGMLAAESLFSALFQDSADGEQAAFDKAFQNSDLYQELHKPRNFVPYVQKMGTLLGGACAWLDINLFAGKVPWTLHNRTPDYKTLHLASKAQAPQYESADNQLTFDRLSSVFLANTHHEENQPCHLQLRDAQVPITQNLKHWNEPAQRYCPAGVYEIVKTEEGAPQLRINAANCVHCKTCDIKDPSQNITWVPPEGGSGPRYPNM